MAGVVGVKALPSALPSGKLDGVGWKFKVTRARGARILFQWSHVGQPTPGGGVLRRTHQALEYQLGGSGRKVDDRDELHGWPPRGPVNPGVHSLIGPAEYLGRATIGMRRARGAGATKEYPRVAWGVDGISGINKLTAHEQRDLVGEEIEVMIHRQGTTRVERASRRHGWRLVPAEEAARIAGAHAGAARVVKIPANRAPGMTTLSSASIPTELAAPSAFVWSPVLPAGDYHRWLMRIRRPPGRWATLEVLLGEWGEVFDPVEVLGYLTEFFEQPGDWFSVSWGHMVRRAGLGGGAWFDVRRFVVHYGQPGERWGFRRFADGFLECSNGDGPFATNGQVIEL